MAPSSGELWGHKFMPVSVELTILVPTGHVLMLTASRDQELREIKRMVQREAEKHEISVDFGKYVFKGVRNDGEYEEFYDETRLLCDLRLFMPIIMLQEPQGNRAEKILNTEIGHCINFSLQDLSSMSKLDAQMFRQRILLPSAQYAVERLSRGGKDRLLRYLYLSEVMPSLSRGARAFVERSEVISIEVFYVTSSDTMVGSTLRLPPLHTSVSAVVTEGLRMISRAAGNELRSSDAADFVFKVCCSDQYLLDQNCPLIFYKYVQDCLENGEKPNLLLMSRAELMQKLPPDDTLDFIWPSDAGEQRQLLPPTSSAQTFPPLSSIASLLTSPLVLTNADGVALRNPPIVTGSGSSLHLSSNSSGMPVHVERQLMWEMNDKFAVRVDCVSGVRRKDNALLMVRLRIHHGKQLLCPPMETPLADIRKPQWKDWVVFDLPISNIPRGARLTMTLLQVIRRQPKKANQESPLGWTQLSLIDFRGILRNDRRCFLDLAAPTAGQWDEVQQLILPNKNSLNLQLVVKFPNYPTYLEYPDIDSPMIAREINEIYLKDFEACAFQQTQYLDQVQHGNVAEIMSRDMLSELSDQECAMVWSLRHQLVDDIQFKHILPRLVESVPWNDRRQVMVFYNILKRWRPVEPDTALQLLGTDSGDPRVRQFAVRSLQLKLGQRELQYYLLQLTQMLKLEPYLDNALTRYLLFNALENASLGEKLFWYLRSEMHQAEVQLRFGLILEAFCRGCGPLRPILVQQCMALDKLSFLSDHLKQQKEEDQIRVFQEKLDQLDIRRCISNFISPLDLSQTLGELDRTQCDIKKSKKRPLWLVWKNPDPLSGKHFNDYKLIFKHGDDLRQDMLTLQMLRLMDSIWKSEGIDLKLIPYGCLATGLETGLIEAVRNASTVMAIQKKATAAALQIDGSQILRWLLSCNGNNQDGDDFKRAVEVFRRSCAGYCVATFVLGVRDRHPDNIMVSKSGHLFHIDFGHFLNNRKKKFGINRERVPFVLTKDFIHVISRGGGTNSKEFQDFTNLCGEAYKVLRGHADLILTLFSMMIHCGLPELQSLSELEYIRKTLAVEMAEADAHKYFRRQLEEAATNAWKTEVNWFFHFVKN